MAKEDTIVTKFGIAQYPYLTTEDPTYGKYKTMLKLTGPETKELKKQAEDFVKANFKGKKIKGLPFKDHEELGECLYGTSKYQPVIVNGKNQKIELAEGQYIGGGTTMRLKGNFHIANDYCVFYITGVQIKNLVLAQGGGGGFDEVEDDEDGTEDLDI